MFAAISFAVGSMVGAGVFVLSGLVVQTAGPSAILSYLFCGILVLFSGLSYAALASIFPEDGGGYLYAKRMLGDRLGFLSGWGMYYFSTISNAFVLIGFGIYFGLLFSVSIDARILALVALLALTAINLRGVADAGRTEVILVGTKLAILIGLVIFGIFSISGSDFTPLAPNGAVGLLEGMVMVFFAYTGFQVASMMAGEIKESSVKVPIATIASILIVMVIYVGVIVALLAANLPSYGSESVFDAAVVLIGSIGGTIIAFAAVVSTLSSSNASIVGSSRIILSMASERQLPGRFAKMRHGGPWNAIILGSLITAVFVIYGDLNFIVDITNVAVLSAMFLVNLSAIQMMRHHKDILAAKKYFRIPLGPVFPMMGAASSIGMIFLLPPLTILIGLATLALGLVFFFIEDTPRGKAAIEEIRAEMRLTRHSHHHGEKSSGRLKD